MARRIFVAILALGVATIATVLSGLPEVCLPEFGAAERVAVETPNSTATIVVDGRRYEASASALLDYMPRISGPLDSVAARRHPLNVVLSVSAASRADVEDARFTCTRVTHGSEVWSKRATNYGVESPQWDAPGDSWRLAMALGGPEWPTGDRIALEATLNIAGRRFILVYEPFELMRGG